jgi:hypothetical protein
MERISESVRQVFQIADPAIDQDELAHRLAVNLENHDLQSPERWPEFAIAPIRPGERPPFPDEVYVSLVRASEAYDQIWVKPKVASSRFSLITRLKRAFHQLVIYYVNQLGERQMVVNDRLLRVVNQLVARHEQSEPQIAELQQRITELEARLEQIEQVSK